ncbi:MAG: hypothetical protein ACR2QJ_11805 [Geminicoccaceae bacterium]
MPRHVLGRIKLSVVIGAILAAGSLQAQDFETLSKEERKQFISAYAELDTVDQVLVICNELAPDYAAANQTIMAEYRASRSIDKARPLVKSFVAWIEAENALAKKTLSLTLNLTRKAVRAALVKRPEQCGASFQDELFGEELKGIAALVQTYELETADADVTETTPAPATPAASAPAVQQAAAEPIQPAAPTPTGGLAMPTPIVDDQETLPGLTWDMPASVEYAESGTVYCVWRCSVFQYVDEIHPWLIFHETVPLPAEQAIDAVVAEFDEKPILRQQTVDASSYAGQGAMRADHVAARNVYIDDYGDSENRRSLIAWERDGLSVVTEFVYLYSNEPPAERQQALLSVLASLQMDADAVRGSLNNPRPPSIIASKGKPPPADQVIYAVNPNPRSNVLTLNTDYDRDARYFDKAVVDQAGDVFEMDGSTYYYIPPRPDGAVIEGVFKSSSAYVLTKTLVFSRDGRFSMSAPRGRSTRAEGSYHISGYTLELRLDDGTVQEKAFFPYVSRVFWPGSDARADEFFFINLGGNIMYRDDG